MLAAIQAQINKLNPVPCTVVTDATGQRFVEGRDGCVTRIGTDVQDEAGQWAVLDEASALGVASSSDGKADTTKSQLCDSLNDDAVSLIALHAGLGKLWKWYQIGLPINVIRRKTDIEGVDDDTPAAIVETFIGLLTQLKDISVDNSADSPSKFEPDEMHGILGDESWDAPQLSASCSAIARPGYNSSQGHEYLDTPEVLREKVKLLARMIQASSHTVVYAGAGLSTGSGINDYATRTGSAGTLAKRTGGANHTNPLSPYCALPNLGHRVLAGLGRQGLIWRFIQQNHDGLPQKAGMPQKIMNEIHGAWFDPSNPVVSMSGNLREDLFADLTKCEQSADLAIAVGTSLCGMNADRIVSSTSFRARSSESFERKRFTPKPGEAIGSVIISLQKTVHDANASLRIFALIDDVMGLLANELAIDVPEPGLAPMSIPNEAKPLGPDIDVFVVPYDKHGNRVNGDEEGATTMVLDLREGAESHLTLGPQKGASATIVGKNKDGMWRVSVARYITKPDGTQWASKVTEPRLLGYWWVQEACQGALSTIPISPKELSAVM